MIFQFVGFASYLYHHTLYLVFDIVFMSPMDKKKLYGNGVAMMGTGLDK